MALKNLGTVRAIHINSSPPLNTQMLWYNTGVNFYVRYKHHYYDILTTQWRELGSDSPLSVTLNNDNIVYVTIGSKSTHHLIQTKFRISRSTSVATGLLEVINDGSSVQIYEPNGRNIYGSDSEVGESAVAITVGYSGDNIRLIVTVSNTGHNGTLNLFSIQQIV